MPSSFAVRITWIADRSLAAKIAVGRSGSDSRVRAGDLGGFLGEPALLHEVRIERDAGQLEREAIAGLAAARRLEVGASGEESDAAMAEPEQVLGGGDGTLEVLGVDGRERRSAEVRVDGDDGMGGVDLDHGRRDQDDAVGERAAEAGEVATLPALLGAHPGVDHELVVGPVERAGRRPSAVRR